MIAGDKVIIKIKGGKLKKGMIATLLETPTSDLLRVSLPNDPSPALVMAHDTIPYVAKITREEKKKNWLEKVRQTPMIYVMAGWIIREKGRIRLSSPAHSLVEFSQKLEDSGVDFEVGKTLTGGDLAQGPSCPVTVKNPGVEFLDRFMASTKVTCTVYQEEGVTLKDAKKISMQREDFVIKILLGDLGFLPSSKDEPTVEQDVDAIRDRVPQQFKEAFEDGLLGNISKYSVEETAVVS